MRKGRGARRHLNHLSNFPLSLSFRSKLSRGEKGQIVVEFAGAMEPPNLLKDREHL